MSCGNADPLEGKYANYFKVGYNAFEFVVDHGQFYNETQEPLLHTRIVTSPAYIKALLMMIQDSVNQYEQDFGLIRHEGKDDE